MEGAAREWLCLSACATMSVDRAFQRIWYGRSRVASIPLVPLSWLFAALAGLRRNAYRVGLLRRHRLDVPVLVVGNVTVGGTGKTPFTIWLAERLSARGLSVGIVLRGYRGSSPIWPRHIQAHTPWQEVGDEPVLIARRTSAIVVAGPDRVAAARHAVGLGAEIIVSDDGLQHYRLERDCEILVVDGTRLFGNGRMLPAGPLREPQSRCERVDLRVVTVRDSLRSATPLRGTLPTIYAQARVTRAVNLVSGETRALHAFVGDTVHAVAAIGHPEGFFAALEQRGLTIQAHAYPDHAPLAREHIVFADDAPVLMTEKDAVKCAVLADARHWAVPLEIALDEQDERIVDALLERVLSEAR